MNQISKQTFSDLSVIFKMMPNEMIKKINPKFINFVKENCDKNYTSNIKPYIPIRKQDISIETQSVLALISILLDTSTSLKHFLIGLGRLTLL